MSQPRGCTPGLPIGFRIELNGQQRQICQSAVAKIAVMTAAADAHLQNICDLQPPKSGHPCAALAEQIESVCHRRRGLVAVNPCQRDRAVEHKAHARPWSLHCLSEAQSNEAVPCEPCSDGALRKPSARMRMR